MRTHGQERDKEEEANSIHAGPVDKHTRMCRRRCRMRARGCVRVPARARTTTQSIDISLDTISFLFVLRDGPSRSFCLSSPTIMYIFLCAFVVYNI